MNHPARIRAITFDADDTLWSFSDAMHAALESVLPQLHDAVPESAHLTVEDLIRFRDEEEAKARQGSLSLLDLETIRLRSFERALTSVNRPDPALAQDLFDHYVESRFGFIEPFPDVLPTMESLRTRFRVGVLTNGNTRLERIRHVLPVDFAVYAADHGVGKPDPRIFEVAARHAGCATTELLHVGDSVEDDIVGAQRSGAMPVWLNRSDASPHPEFPHVTVIGTLSELPPLLQSHA